jgi:hypothetical protein
LLKTSGPSRLLLIGALAVALTLLLAAIGALLSAPLWIDAAAVKKEIAALVLKATGDVVEIDRLQLHLFPPVSVEIAGPRYAVANVAEVTARSVTVDLSLWALVTGKVQPRSIRMTAAEATIRLPTPAADEKPTSLAAVEQQVRVVLTQLTQAAPDLNATADDAIVTVHLPDRPPFVLNDVDAQISTSGGKIDVKVSAVSEISERVSLAFSILGESLQGEGRLEFVGLDAGGLLDLAGFDASLPRAEADLIGRIDWQMRGLSDLKAEAVASTPRLTLHRNGAAQEIRGIVTAAGLELKGPAMKLSVHRLYAQAPNLLLDAGLSRDERGHHELVLHASGADLVALQSAARTLASDISWISKPPALLRAGTLTALHLDGSGDSLSELFDIPVLRGEATLEGVTVDIAQPALTLSGAGGRIAIDHGDLQVRNATATLGKSTLRNGQLAMHLTDDPDDLRAEALIDLDLGEAIALAKRLIRRKDIDLQLQAVQKLEGKAQAQVALWGNPRALQASVEMSELALFARHRHVPLPLRLSGGQFTYAKGAISLHDAAGEFGRSGFEDLDASLALSPPYRFEVSQRNASLSLEELHAAARQVPALAPALAEIRNLTGKASLSEVVAEGSLQKPDATRFRAVVSPHNAKLLSQRVDAEILFDGGQIEFTDRLIDAREVSVSAMDSALHVSAHLEDYRAGIRAIDAMVNGDLGATTLERVYKAAGLAPALQLRAPLHFSDSKVAWKGNGDVSFTGKAKAAGTIDLDIAARKAGNKLDLDRLTLKDASSDLILSGEYAGENINAAFKGKLTGATLADLLVQPPVSMDKVEGDMQADLHLGHPWITRLQGKLEASSMAIPGDRAIPIKVEHVTLTGSGEKIDIEQAVLSVGDSRMEISGDFHRENEKIVLDADLRADRIVLSKALMESRQRSDGNEPAFRLSDLPITGRLGLDIRILESERVTLAPLVADVAIAGENLDLRITEAALCGLTMSGNLRGRLEDLRLAGGLSARDADLQKSIACLTSERIVGSGRLDVDAQFTAQGPLTLLGERLDGEFTATARDGNIEKFDTLNRVFAFLNVTELVRGKKIGVNGSGLPYQTAQVKGTLAGTAVHIEEAVLDGQTVHVVASGNIDYGNGNLGMDVLVAPLQTANAILDKIPIVKRIFGGTVLALPVQVLGTVQNPIVVPLGPGAVASRMTSIFANTMRLPIDAVKIFSPNASAKDSGGGIK